MKRGLLVSFIAASVLSMAQANGFERVNTGWMSGGMPEVEEHMADVSQKKENMEKKEQELTQQLSEAKEKVGQPKEPTPQPSQMQKGVGLGMTEGVMEHQNEAGSSEQLGNMQEEIQNEINGGKESHLGDMQKEIQENIEQHQNEQMSNLQKEIQDGVSGGKGSHLGNMQSEIENGLGQGKQEHLGDMQKEMQENMEDALNEGHKKGEEKKPHLSLVDLVEDKGDMGKMSPLPEDVKELLHEVKKAAKLYKKEELFKEFNISDVADLQQPQIKEQIQELIEEAKKERMQEISQELLQKRAAKIAGEFAKFGPGQYDWVFVTKSGDVYKLVGVTESGNFDYKKLSGVKGIIDKNGQVKIVASQITNDIEAQIANKEFKGYPFANYNDPNENGFDWVVVTGNKVFKLEGFDPDSKSFVYTPAPGVIARPQGDEVELLPGQ